MTQRSTHGSMRKHAGAGCDHWWLQAALHSEDIGGPISISSGDG